MQEVGVFTKSVAVPAEHLNQVVPTLVVGLPAVNAVKRGCPLELAEDELVVFNYASHVLDSNSSIQRVVTV